MTVKHCANDSDYQSFMVNAGTTPVITKFSAAWCGPCKAIAPFFNALSLTYSQLKFAEVDVDQCVGSKNQFGITAMPTFVVVINGQKMDVVRGADKNALEQLVQKWAANIPTQHESPIPGQSDLAYLVDASGLECLNEDNSGTLRALIENTHELSSDCDEQLIINIPFTTPVKVHSILIEGPSGKSPKSVKVFANLPNTLDFDKAQSSDAVQTLDFETSTIQSLKYVKFQNVKNLQLFIENNCEGGDCTVIATLRLFGQPVRGATDMGEFKRVAGKAGEASH